MSETKPIVLKAQSANNCVGLIRITPEAERVLRRLNRRTGISMCRIVSEILIQAEHLICIDYSDDSEGDDGV